MRGYYGQTMTLEMRDDADAIADAIAEAADLLGAGDDCVHSARYMLGLSVENVKRGGPALDVARRQRGESGWWLSYAFRA